MKDIINSWEKEEKLRLKLVTFKKDHRKIKKVNRKKQRELKELMKLSGRK